MSRGTTVTGTRALRGAVVAVGLLAGGCFWSSPGQGPDRRAHNDLETAITAETVAGLSLAWEAAVDEGPVGDPVTSARAVHVHDTRSTYGFASGTGTRLWDHDVTAPDTMDQPFVDGDRVVVSMSVGGTVPRGAHVEVDAVTGAALTERDKGRLAGIRGDRRLTFADGRHFGGQIWLYEVLVTDAATGGFLCCAGLFGAGPHPPTVPPLTLGTDTVLHSGYGAVDVDVPPTDLGGSGNGVRGYTIGASRYCDPSQPSSLCANWATPLAGTTATPPVLTPDGTTAGVGTDTGLVAAVDAATGTLRWTAQLAGAVTDSPALAHGTLFVPTATGDLVALDADGCGATTCAPLWAAPTGSRVTQQPAVAGGVVVTGSADGALHAFPAAGCGAATCAPLWSADAGSEVTGAPAVSGGRLYVGTAAGRLLAYEL